MKFLEIAIIVGLIVWAVLAVRSLKKKGGCGGNCCGCQGCAKADSCRDCAEEKRGS
jgi:hypothetical protein